MKRIRTAPPQPPIEDDALPGPDGEKKHQKSGPAKGEGGRPSLYNPDYHCPMVIALMSDGLSRYEVARELGISYTGTLYEWEGKYPEFAEALKEGEAMSQAWWLTEARHNLGNPKFNSILWMMNMGNRFRWSRNPENKPMEPEKPASTITNNFDFSGWTDTQVNQLLKKMGYQLKQQEAKEDGISSGYRH